MFDDYGTMEAASSTAMCTAKTGTLGVLRTLWWLDKLRLWEIVMIWCFEFNINIAVRNCLPTAGTR